MKKSYNIYGKNINNNRIFSSVLVCFMLVGLAAYGIYFNIKSSKTDRILQQQYQRTFTDMSDYVNKAENYLLKAMAAGTPPGPPPATITSAAPARIFQAAWLMESMAEPHCISTKEAEVSKGRPAFMVM